MQQGIEQGIEQGITREKNLVIRLIERKLGEINLEIKTQIQGLEIEEIEALVEAIFDFANVEDLITWLAWGQKLSIQGRASFSGSGVEEDRRVNQRVLNFPIAENPIVSLAIAKKPHSSCHKSTSSKACPAWHSA